MESPGDLLAKLNRLFNGQRKALFQSELSPKEERQYIARKKRIETLLAHIKPRKR